MHQLIEKLQIFWMTNKDLNMNIDNIYYNIGKAIVHSCLIGLFIACLSALFGTMPGYTVYGLMVYYFINGLFVFYLVTYAIMPIQNAIISRIRNKQRKKQ